MPGIRIYTSNFLEILVNELAELLREPLLSPVEKEVVVVQSSGMERWISLELAKRHGICANYRFPFPKNFMEEVFRAVIPDFKPGREFEPAVLSWIIAGHLPSCMDLPVFETLNGYLGGMNDDLKRIQLSERIADTFDQYLVFRPEMIFSWEEGGAHHWQAVLWRRLVKEAGQTHRASMAREFVRRLKMIKEIEGLPGRVSVFGISALPRLYMELLSGISRFVDVNLFLMNPCREYWGDIVSERSVKKRLRRMKKGEPDMKGLHLEKGNSLLASMGTLGRDFFDIVNEFPSEEFQFFAASDGGSLLARIQDDILSMLDRDSGPDNRSPVSPDDNSIQIHSCHSPMRELEILQDRLLDMFEKNPDLVPLDIVVMTPHIEVYAPYIQAVFDLPVDDSRRIPFSIADRGLRDEGRVTDVFLKILDLRESRFRVSQILALLESPSIRRSFGLRESDIDLIQTWTRETRIRWGMNALDRENLGLPPYKEHTWESGIERLVTGYAMLCKGERLFQDILPWDHLEGDDALVLGRFIEFINSLFSFVASFQKRRCLMDWSENLNGLLEKFFSQDEDSVTEMRIIRTALNELSGIQKTSRFEDEMDIRVIRWHLKSALEKKGFGAGFITGGVTFCAMLPMRSIPFKVVCLLGMDGHSFPRQSHPVGFDFISRYPKPGDRSRRKDDKYLFLEAVLSARQRLYISYVGQDIRDNSSIPPSVLVSELIDYIEKGFFMEGRDVLDHILTRHRLQPFSRGYFGAEKKLFSYSERNLRAAQCLEKGRKKEEPFFSGKLAEPDDSFKTIDLEELCRFFSNPARFLITRRLGIYLRDTVSAQEETEPFAIKGLDRYSITRSLLDRKLSGGETEEVFRSARAAGLLPHGAVGECMMAGLDESVEKFAEELKPFVPGPPSDPMEVDIPVSGFRITGMIRNVYHHRFVHYLYGRLKARHRLRTWIVHLALSTIAPDGGPRISMLAGLDAYGGNKSSWTAWEYAPQESPIETLEKLLGIYWSGLIKPVPFFPETSWSYVAGKKNKGESPGEWMNRARKVWRGNEYSPGESADEYIRLCFKDSDPLDEDFCRISEEVFEKLIESQRRV